MDRKGGCVGSPDRENGLWIGVCVCELRVDADDFGGSSQFKCKKLASQGQKKALTEKLKSWEQKDRWLLLRLSESKI